ncbi:tyrosine-protein kinase receptor UFO-like, partial [Notechis scutatus]|uniref:Tyrosine-protein kinase receptor UFO-like n=1 Tax=Notechis scutatus TaxID=8663 RepID=A0A6J1W373_9SAUR
MGNYRCVASVNGSEFFSEEAYLQLEGLPFFSEEPQDLEVTAGTLFNLSCGAQGPPEPVLVIWLQDSVPLNSLADLLAETPSVLGVRGESVHATPHSTTARPGLATRVLEGVTNYNRSLK